jgi:predicted nucleotidyltransferase
MYTAVMDERTKLLSDWLADVLQRFPFVRRAVLFGSRARGDNSARSDYDLALDVAPASASDWCALGDAIDRAPTLLKFDVVRLEDVSPDLRAEIEREGIQIYGRKPSAA